jgi:hypothetical protein
MPRRFEISVKPGGRSGEVPNAPAPTATSTTEKSMPIDGVYIVDASAGLTGDIEIRPSRKVRVIDAWCVATAAGAAADTITIKNNTTAITDAMDLNIVDKTVARAGTIDDAAWDVDPNASTAQDIVVTGASAAKAIVFIRVIPVA